MDTIEIQNGELLPFDFLVWHSGNAVIDIESVTKLNLTTNMRYGFTDELRAELMDSVCKLTNLEYLSLEGNNLISLPDDIGNLTKLKELNLSKNELSRLPDTIGNLTQLQKLNLSENNLSILPESITNLQNLEYIDIYNNPLYDILINNQQNNQRNNQRNNQQNNQQNNENLPMLEVHKAFDKVNKDDLFIFFKDNNITINTDLSNRDFISYVRSSLDSFISSMNNSNSRKKIAKDDINNIFREVLNNLKYPDEYKEMISYCLEYVKKQPEKFQNAYVSNFTYDCAHAYNGEYPLSCAKGIIERFVTSLVPAALLYITNNEHKSKKYDILIDIISFDAKKVIAEIANDCYITNIKEDSYKDCIRNKLKDRLKERYNNSLNKNINEYVSTLGYFGGKRWKTRKGYTKRYTAKHKKTLSKKKLSKNKNSTKRKYKRF